MVSITKKPTVSRRSLFQTGLTSLRNAGAIILVGGLGDRSADVTKAAQEDQLQNIRVQHQWVLDAALGGMFYASEEGFYRDAGLEVEILPGGAGLDPVVPVLSGQALIGIHTNAASVIIPKSRGVPLRVIASQYQKSPIGLVTKASSGIKEVQDFRNKRIGLVQSSFSILEVMLKLNGLEGQVQPVVLAPTNYLPALLDDMVDILVGFKGNHGVQLELMGIPYVFFYFDDLGYRQESYPFFVHEQSLSERREVLESFLAATRRGWEYVIAHPEVGAQLSVANNPAGSNLAAATGLAEETVALMQSEITETNGLLYMNRETWEVTNRVLADTGLIEGPLDLDELLTWELL